MEKLRFPIEYPTALGDFMQANFPKERNHPAFGSYFIVGTSDPEKVVLHHWNLPDPPPAPEAVLSWAAEHPHAASSTSNDATVELERLEKDVESASSLAALRNATLAMFRSLRRSTHTPSR